MGKKNRKLAIILVAALSVAVVFALVLDAVGSPGVDLSEERSYSIVISEICSKNETVLADSDGKYPDYIELYNGGETVSLEGFSLTDGKGVSEPFGNIILGAGEYRVFFLGDDLTGFGIGASGGDCIQLQDPFGNIVTQANTTTLQADQVMLYSGGVYHVSDKASPGFENTDSGAAAFRKGSEAKDPGIVISEVLIGNVSSLSDENGNFGDVVELYNRTSEPVYLGSYFLSDRMELRFRFRLPDVYLEAGAYLAVYCDGQNYIGPGGEVHAGFALSHGEDVVLTDNSGSYQSVAAQYFGDDISLSLTDGSYAQQDASPGFANSEEGIQLFRQSRINSGAPLVISEVLLSTGGVPHDGAFCDVVEIRNRSGNTVSTAGWYLSDGGDPYAYPLPEKNLAAGECILISCSVQTTGFALSEGEVLRLLGPDHLYAQPVSCVATDPGTSISLLGDGEELVYSAAQITLGYGNDQQNHEAYLKDQYPQGLMISEVMSANLSYLPGSYKTVSDWIEVYNGSDKTLNLADYRITDDGGKLDKYAMPDRTLEPGEYCVIFLNKDSANLLRGYPVLPFSLSSEGERLYLSLDGVIVDYALVPELATDVSYGRGSGSFAMAVLADVTPGEANGAAVGMAPMPTVMTPQGCYDDVEYVDVVLSGEGEIYYTLDCTEPGSRAIRYTGPIRLTGTTVLRVECRQQGKRDSETLDLTYVINENDELPVVSVVAEPDDLFSYMEGIYVAGPNVSDEPPYYGANYWMDWEKEASLSLFETDGSGFSVNCGIKIFGAYTRSLPKKSMACMFRDSYGDGELSYPLFGSDSLDSYESIVLRTSGQDSIRARMRDVVITSLMHEATGIPVQQYKPVVVYINGRYWGLHYIREKLNENYVAGHFNVSADTVTMVEHAGWSSPEYRQLINYMLEHDMTVPEDYDYACSQIDVDNYIDFYAAQLWIANTDNGNVKYFRIGDGKWTWCFFDTDLSMLEASLDNVRANLYSGTLDNTNFTGKTFAAKMLHNKEFRDKFLTRLAWQMNNVWTEENIIARVDEIEALIETDMIKDCERWDYSYTEWQRHVERIREFARERSGYLLDYLQRYFGLTDQQMRDYGFAV